MRISGRYDSNEVSPAPPSPRPLHVVPPVVRLKLFEGSSCLGDNMSLPFQQHVRKAGTGGDERWGRFTDSLKLCTAYLTGSPSRPGRIG